MGFRDFPVTELGPPDPDQVYNLVDLKKKDSRGNGLYLLGKGNPDKTYLVLWDLGMGYRGGASYNVEGQASIIAYGQEAQGDAGKMGSADCPLVWVTGPCYLTWEREGRLYGSPSDWVASFDGREWIIAPADQCSVEQDIFNY